MSFTTTPVCGPILNPFGTTPLTFDAFDEPFDMHPTDIDPWTHQPGPSPSLHPEPIGPDPTTPDDELVPGEVRLFGHQVAAGTNLRGRLRDRYARWLEYGAAPQVLDWVRHGYRIPFQDSGRPAAFLCSKNHAGATTHADWLRGAIQELCSIGAVEPWAGPAPPKVVSPLNVVPKSNPGKFRLILDLRYVNQYQVQNGHVGPALRPLPAGGLDDRRRPSVGLSPPRGVQGGSGVPGLSIRRPILCLPLPALRPDLCTTHIHAPHASAS